jgi:drug/metabolite transporter (DMT)-like permease
MGLAAAAGVTMVLWASAFVAIRSAGGHFPPGALALGRLLVASLALGVVWLLSSGGWPARAAWPGILGSGLLWFGLYMVALNWGERDVGPGTAAMLVNIGPILLALLAGWLLHGGSASAGRRDGRVVRRCRTRLHYAVNDDSMHS